MPSFVTLPCAVCGKPLQRRTDYPRTFAVCGHLPDGRFSPCQREAHSRSQREDRPATGQYLPELVLFSTKVTESQMATILRLGRGNKARGVREALRLLAAAARQMDRDRQMLDALQREVEELRERVELERVRERGERRVA